ncbi:conserved protein of unknown function [Methanocaldococcus lauensis]|uniref:Uncharacterized protein n=1 Tax=Methanocaldococcus lauensis TaxID=2546128 RepID=A0A8D6Q2X1_9EURY|nr:hypothetical protein [Methanocaldococcus lauensis]CAB3290184.1 conserved protein of unknown function [Methanocaldococcus lauensis]
MDKFLKLLIKSFALFIGFVILDFIVEYYFIDGLTILLWVSAIIFACLCIVFGLIYEKIKINISYLPFNKENKNVRN